MIKVELLPLLSALDSIYLLLTSCYFTNSLTVRRNSFRATTVSSFSFQFAGQLSHVVKETLKKEKNIFRYSNEAEWAKDTSSLLHGRPRPPVRNDFKARTSCTMRRTNEFEYHISGGNTVCTLFRPTEIWY